jgi:hypothetical protein
VSATTVPGAPAVTVTSVDPVTGEIVVVEAPAVDSGTGDPGTGDGFVGGDTGAFNVGSADDEQLASPSFRLASDGSERIVQVGDDGAEAPVTYDQSRPTASLYLVTIAMLLVVFAPPAVMLSQRLRRRMPRVRIERPPAG